MLYHNNLFIFTKDALRSLRLWAKKWWFHSDSHGDQGKNLSQKPYKGFMLLYNMEPKDGGSRENRILKRLTKPRTDLSRLRLHFAMLP